jgi:predicted double-glycine peptidase
MSLKRSNLAAFVCSLLLVYCETTVAGATPLVRSLLETRNHNVVVQNWDLSCGAAALATILNFQHGDNVSERTIATGLMARPEYLENPIIVRIRQGFSLLDLKRFVDGRGYHGIGLGRLTFEHLVDRAPVIVPINTHGYQHFVVFRGTSGNRVLLADPAFGNRTMLRSEFERAWLAFNEIGHVGFVVERTDGLTPPNRLEPKPLDFVTFN